MVIIENLELGHARSAWKLKISTEEKYKKSVTTIWARILHSTEVPTENLGTSLHKMHKIYTSLDTTKDINKK